MDPLSVTASIVGILAAAAKIGELLTNTISTAHDAPRVLPALACEVRQMQAALSSLQTLLINLSSTQPHRAAMIQLDQLIVTLTDAALTLSQLETAIIPFIQASKLSVKGRLKWTRTEKECTSIVQRLQRHKASMTLMLNILQCASDADADRSRSSLERMIQELLRSNQSLSRRLQNLEDSFDARSTFTRKCDDQSFIMRDDATITTVRPKKESTSIVEAVAVRFAFDDDLQSSRVYRMVKENHCNHSCISSVIHTQSWSIFSGLSLADISIISVIALPLYQEDLLNHASHYSFGADELPKLPEVFATPISGQTLVEAQSSPSPSPSTEIDHHFQATQPLNVTDDSASATSTSNYRDTLTTSDASSSTSISSGQIPTHEVAPPQAEPPSSNHENKDTRLRQRLDSVNLENDQPISDPGIEDANHKDVYPCQVCTKVLKDGKVYELAGRRWHTDCFRCNTCNALLDSDSDLLLLQNGILICNDCTYSCCHCDKKIEDIAYITGDKAYCASCFRCRNCKRKIENLRYARTSQGIFCMNCHESLMARRRKKKREREEQLLKSTANPDSSNFATSSGETQPNNLPVTTAAEPSFFPDFWRITSNLEQQLSKS